MKLNRIVAFGLTLLMAFAFSPINLLAGENAEANPYTHGALAESEKPVSTSPGTGSHETQTAPKPAHSPKSLPFTGPEKEELNEASGQPQRQVVDVEQLPPPEGLATGLIHKTRAAQEYSQLAPSRGSSAVATQVNLMDSGYFPPINSQGALNSCTAFAATYYLFTYEVARLNANDPNWDVTKPEYQFSAKQVYNTYNGGGNSSSQQDSPLGVLQRGAVRQSEFPYPMGAGSVTQQHVAELDWNKEHLYKALEYRMSDYKIIRAGMLNEDTPVTGPNSPALDNIKTILNMGHPILVTTYSPSNFDDGDIYADRPVLRAGGNYGHSMVVVGYDDTYTFDMDGDGAIQEYETGAMLVANSWGASYKGKGWTYVMYDALNQVSNCNNLNGETYTLPWNDTQAFTSTRRPFLTYADDLIYIDVAKYDVGLAVELSLMNTSRSTTTVYGRVDAPGLGSVGVNMTVGLLMNFISMDYGANLRFNINAPATEEVTYVLPYDTAAAQAQAAGGAELCTWYIGVNNNWSYYGNPTPIQVMGTKLVRNPLTAPEVVAESRYADGLLTNTDNRVFKIGGP